MDQEINFEKKQTVLEASKHIKHHRKLETEGLIRPEKEKNLAVAFASVFLKGEQRKIWLTNRENLGGYSSLVNITGFITNTEAGHPTTITSDGYAVYKNSPFGEFLIRNLIGTHPYNLRTVQYGKSTEETNNVTIYHFSTFVPDRNKAEAHDVVINLEGHKPTFISVLSDFLANERGRKKRIELQEKVALDHTLEAELRELEAKLKQEEDKRALLKNARSFIRANAELRYQPILDPEQEAVKRGDLFDNTLVIDGGPGTGKTTALIQRLKFLTDRTALVGAEKESASIFEMGYLPKMTESQKQVLFNSNNWVFFSPSQLLKLFLKESMIKEGLSADNTRLLIWSDYSLQLMKAYKFVNIETQNPFKVLNKFTDQNLLPVSGEELKKILESLDQFFLNAVLSRLTQVSGIKVSAFTWGNKALEIQATIERGLRNKNWASLIRLFLGLEESYSADAARAREDLRDYYDSLSKKILVNLKNSSVHEGVFAFGGEWMNEGSTESEPIDPETEVEVFSDQDAEEEENTADIELFLLQKIKGLIRTLALMKYDKSTRLSKRQKELWDLMASAYPIEEEQGFDKHAQLAFFDRYFGRIVTGGIVSNIFRLIPTMYKSFRKVELKARSGFWNYDLLKHLVELDAEKNKRLHPNEFSLLIYLTNRLIKQSIKISPSKTANINHPYFTAFRDAIRPVIGVDEASDYHLVDILAIQSLSHPEISSVTYSGDLMQRLTHGGVRTWEDLSLFIDNLQIKKLQVSYRQSPTLLEIAKGIYHRATQGHAQYVSFSERDPKEPAPLLYRNDSQEEQIEWISGRILEIYKAYGDWIPSIAVFLPHESEIENFARSLGQMDALGDVGINVVACNKGQILGDQNSVRVFSVDYIKGLEFEAVFFHRIDHLHSGDTDEELVLKNLYVGLSRASFFMAATCSIDSYIGNYLEDLFHKGPKTWKM
ncbi:MAG: hypothetical protein SF052_07035 [Bacteroidia bacterium]|nr:hypothetical protein [Bacteroidia bacterium]